MKLQIWDNGGHYSDHRLFFIKADIPEQDLVEGLKLYRGYRSDARIIGDVEAKDGFSGSVATVWDVLDEISFHFYGNLDDDDEKTLEKRYDAFMARRPK